MNRGFQGIEEWMPKGKLPEAVRSKNTISLASWVGIRRNTSVIGSFDARMRALLNNPVQFVIIAVAGEFILTPPLVFGTGRDNAAASDTI